MTGPKLEVDTAELTALAGQFYDLGKQLQGAVTAMEPGPDFQPSSAAVTELAASADHVTKVAGFRLSGYGGSLTRAANAYDSTDTSTADKVAGTMRPGG
ncbi:hypothetical protein A5792_06905 [Mycolicibacterium peregrinum]|uniref:ESX-1 secretion-associated protein n=1 Tax=Mycolicibacterium peregrinum TaxID=43304 RepID=A0A1A0QJZ6_MYCPR|nr:type VII secretion target [Mycolicibacterium peregrinum]OBB22228.1 hypothetical protein A5792_06905 [Mycolicibacterium peregrinum]